MPPNSQPPIYFQEIPPAVQPMPQPQPNQPTAQPFIQAPVMNQQQPIIVNQYNPVQPLDLKTIPTTVLMHFLKFL